MEPTLTTPRLVLREMSPDDLDFVAAMLADPDVMRYYPRCYSREESLTWIQRQIRRHARHRHGLWLVLDKASGQPIGQVGLLIQRILGVEEKEVAYLIHRPFWRQGFATEAARACRDYAFTGLGRQRVFALIRPENLASQAVAIKLGMHSDATTVEHSGLEHAVHSISRADWRERQSIGADSRE